MLVLFETAAGFGLFKVSDNGAVENSDKLAEHFATPQSAAELVELKAFHKFESTADALTDITALLDGKISKSLKKFLSEEISEKEQKKEQLAVVDPKLGGSIQKKLGLNVISSDSILDLYRGIRSQLDTLLTGLSHEDLSTMQLGLSHTLSRYKLKFSPDKVDTMIVQAIALLDDLDKELNTYAMRVKEWYGWHFPEMTRIVSDNLAYAKTVKVMGFRTSAAEADLGTVLPEELEEALKSAAEISMGTEISDDDLTNILALCDQVIDITAYRAQLYEYLKNRMLAIAPNLTTLVGELVGARLIAHAGSLMSLAKHPASTIQILGAEKALFRALKTKHDTPKYGLIYHASLIGQAGQKIKGKVARMVATKAAISVRVDALGDKDSSDISVGLENRNKIESRLRQLEGRAVQSISTPGSRVKPAQQAFAFGNNAGYNEAMDSTLNGSPHTNGSAKKTKKRKSPEEEEEEEEDDEESEEVETKKKKKSKKTDDEETPKKKKKHADGDESAKKKSKKEKRKSEGGDGDGEKKKKKKKKVEEDSD